MDKVGIFQELTQRNALRKAAQLPLLDVRAEFVHACAVARSAEWRAFCESKAADIERIQAEVLKELRTKHGAQFPSNSIAALALQRAVARRFEAFAAIHYGAQRPHGAARHPIIYGE
jgi:hypothetical protein